MTIHDVYIDLRKVKENDRISLYEYLNRFKRPNECISGLFDFVNGKYLFYNLGFYYEVISIYEPYNDRKEVSLDEFENIVINHVESYIQLHGDLKILRS